jgi:hypothetical protein
VALCANNSEEGKLTLRRESGLRFVQYIDSLLESIGEQCEEGFTMRLLK